MHALRLFDEMRPSAASTRQCRLDVHRRTCVPYSHAYSQRVETTRDEEG